MVVGTKEAEIMQVAISNHLYARFKRPFNVKIYRDHQERNDVIEVTFFDANGTLRAVDQREPLHSLFGYVGITDETIAKILLLGG